MGHNSLHPRNVLLADGAYMVAVRVRVRTLAARAAYHMTSAELLRTISPLGR